jgi:hypothetical protein
MKIDCDIFVHYTLIMCLTLIIMFNIWFVDPIFEQIEKIENICKLVEVASIHPNKLAKLATPTNQFLIYIRGINKT